MGSAAKNAMTALQPLDRTLYQTYYPEDIQVFGISGSTVLANGTAELLKLLIDLTFHCKFHLEIKYLIFLIVLVEQLFKASP